ncbi:MAG: DNA-binding protein [Oligoflexia bacterium]|nr:DNA-binding protein [Oligoflexia bacterium]
MQWELLSEDEQERTYLLVFETGDELMAKLMGFALEAGITAAHFTAIGAFSEVQLAFFDWNNKSYRSIPVPEQVEAIMVAGDIALKEGRPSIHAHAVVGRADGSTRGGHLRKAVVRPTLELIVLESPRYLQRTFDEESGLALIDLNAVAGHQPAKIKKAQRPAA